MLFRSCWGGVASSKLMPAVLSETVIVFSFLFFSFLFVPDDLTSRSGSGGRKGSCHAGCLWGDGHAGFAFRAYTSRTTKGTLASGTTLPVGVGQGGSCRSEFKFTGKGAHTHSHARACVRVCVHACVRARVHTHTHTKLETPHSLAVAVFVAAPEYCARSYAAVMLPQTSCAASCGPCIAAAAATLHGKHIGAPPLAPAPCANEVDSVCTRVPVLAHLLPRLRPPQLKDSTAIPPRVAGSLSSIHPGFSGLSLSPPLPCGLRLSLTHPFIPHAHNTSS